MLWLFVGLSASLAYFLWRSQRRIAEMEISSIDDLSDYREHYNDWTTKYNKLQARNEAARIVLTGPWHKVCDSIVTLKKQEAEIDD